LHLWQRNTGGKVRPDVCSIRHHRHVAGSAARRKADKGGRRAATRRIDRCNNAIAPAVAKIMGDAAGHRQVADKMRQRVDAALPQTQQLPERAG
jgi:hypothetical protein